MKEIWKDVIGYEEFYSVSNLGRIWSKRKDKEISQSINNYGYFRFIASNNGKSKCISTHRAVAMAFLDNKNNFPEVNHKDENPKNNCVENLEWCTRSYNCSYNDLAIRKSKTKKPVYQYDLNGNFLNLFESGHDACRKLNIKDGNIWKCLNKMTKNNEFYTMKNSVFSYIELTKEDLNKFPKNSCMRLKNNSLSKPVLQFDINGNLIKEYPSCQEVFRELGISSSNISMCCRGELKQSHGYMWKYKERIYD